MKNETVWAVIVFIAIVGVWYLLPTNLDDRGQTAMGALFTGLAFSGFVYTAALQRRDIREARIAQQRAQVLSSGSAAASVLQSTLAANQAEINRLEERYNDASMSDLRLLLSDLKDTEHQLRTLLTSLEERPETIDVRDVIVAMAPAVLHMTQAADERIAEQMAQLTRIRERLPIHAELQSQIAPLIRTIVSLYNQDLATATGREFAEPAELLAQLKRLEDIALK